MRVVIRFSINREKTGKLRNELFAILKSHGINWTGKSTGTYEGYVKAGNLETAMSQFWNAVSNHAGKGRIDHFWMYTDRQAKPLLADPLE